MSKYTTELRFYLTTLAQIESTKPDDVIDNSYAKVFDFPMTTIGSVTETLNWEKRFLRHFYMREVGAETIALWKLWLEDWCTVELPFYSDLYNAALKNIDPYLTDDYTETESGTDKTENSGNDNSSQTLNTTTTSSGSVITSHIDTPQGSLSNFLNGNYVTSATKVEPNNSKTVTSGSPSSTITYGRVVTRTPNITRTHKGYRGVNKATLFKQYYESIRNIDKECFDNADKSLFFQLW